MKAGTMKWKMYEHVVWVLESERDEQQQQMCVCATIQFTREIITNEF